MRILCVILLAASAAPAWAAPRQKPMPPQAPSVIDDAKAPSCGKKNCDCGCKEGEPCRCATAKKKSCVCSPECTCGCNEGKPCGCGAAKGVVREGTAYVPPSTGFVPFVAPAPVYAPAPLPAPAPAPVTYAPAPTYVPATTAPVFRPAAFAAPARGGNC